MSVIHNEVSRAKNLSNHSGVQRINTGQHGPVNPSYNSTPTHTSSVDRVADHKNTEGIIQSTVAVAMDSLPTPSVHKRRMFRVTRPPPESHTSLPQSSTLPTHPLQQQSPSQSQSPQTPRRSMSPVRRQSPPLQRFLARRRAQMVQSRGRNPNILTPPNRFGRLGKRRQSGYVTDASSHPPRTIALPKRN